MAGLQGSVTFVGQVAWLVVSIVIAALACGAWGAMVELSAPWFAAVVAGAVNLLAGLLGFVAVLAATARWPSNGALVGVLVRMAIPLPAGVVLHRGGGELAASHVFGMIVVCYLVMLVTETLLLVRNLPRVGLATRSTDSRLS